MITVCLCLQLVDGHSLFDYNVGLNEIIQLIVQQPRQLTESNKCSLGGDTITEVDCGSDKENQEVGHIQI